MNHNYNTHLLMFKKDMMKNQLMPPEQIIANNQSHSFQVNCNRETKEAHYTATFYPFEADSNGPVFIGWYGLIDNKKRYMYSSLANI